MQIVTILHNFRVHLKRASILIETAKSTAWLRVCKIIGEPLSPWWKSFDSRIRTLTVPFVSANASPGNTLSPSRFSTFIRVDKTRLPANRFYIFWYPACSRSGRNRFDKNRIKICRFDANVNPSVFTAWVVRTVWTNGTCAVRICIYIAVKKFYEFKERL